MSPRRFALVAIAGASLLGGCARYVVIDPALVPSRNARDWTIRSQPGGAPPAVAPPILIAPAPSGDAPSGNDR